jgi:hypothetical protein
MNQNQDNVSGDKVKALEIALKLFEICESAAPKSDETDVAIQVLIEAAEQIAQFIKEP